MIWFFAAWIGLSILTASFIGRFIRFGMTGEIKPPEQAALHPIAELNPTI